MEKQTTPPAWTVAAEIELSYKSNVKPSARPTITGAEDLQQLFLNHWNEEKLELLEQFKVALISRSNRVLGILNLASGTITGVAVDIRLLFAAALKTKATAIAICHNHPSGNLEPSPADRRLTEKIKAAGELLDIDLLDHIILTEDGYFSFANQGLL
ncbi:MAG: JAB domain-containing protein [Pseudobacter sp.]|uniref:JAB domain-containing protein n=1 Tax=Pseudobacter sp. TaxID=2045420 RepID=UPI003F81FB1F